MLETLNDQEVARRLLKEHALLKQLSEELHAATRHLPQHGAAGWLKTLTEKFEHFRAHMYRRLALEEVGGFLRVVEERRPTLSPQVAHLKLEHEEILAFTDAVHAELRQADPADSSFLRECVLRIRHLLSEVEHHEQHENLLVEFVFSQDMGGEE